MLSPNSNQRSQQLKGRRPMSGIRYQLERLCSIEFGLLSRKILGQFLISNGPIGLGSSGFKARNENALCCLESL